MGLFDWFKTTQTNVTVADDMIWLTKQAKFNGIQKATVQSLGTPNGPDAIILVAHFQDCLAELCMIAEQSGCSVTAVSVADLRNAKPSGMSLGESHSLQILVGEHHPLLSHDEAIVESSRSLPFRCRIVFHASLDEPLMRVFAGEWVETVLKRMGMADDEAIESKMVAQRIKAAQKKLASQCDSDFPAESAEEWMERNCPPSLRSRG